MELYLDGVEGGTHNVSRLLWFSSGFSFSSCSSFSSLFLLHLSYFLIVVDVRNIFGFSASF